MTGRAVRKLTLFICAAFVIQIVVLVAAQGQLSGAVAASQLTWHLLAARDWMNYLDVFRSEVAHHEGFIPYKESALSQLEVNGKPIASMSRAWTLPVMSILMSPNHKVQAIVVNKLPGDYQPMDPARPDLFPDLSRYGIHYDRYAAALARQRTPVR